MEALGINLSWYIFQLVNFVLLMWGLKALLYKPLIKLLESRQKEEAESEKLADELNKKQASLEKVKEEIVNEARSEAAKVVSEAKKEAFDVEKRLKAEAEKNASATLAKAKASIDAEKARLKEELSDEITKTVLAVTQKIISDNSELDKKRVDKIVSELK